MLNLVVSEIAIESSPVTAIGVVSLVVGSVVGLIVWIVKQSFARQGAITDRYFSHLEEQAHEQKELNQRYGDHLDRIAGSMFALHQGQEKQNAILEAISRKCTGGGA